MKNKTIPSFSIIGLAIRTSNQDGQSAKDIPELWARFFQEDVLSRIPNKISSELYCIYTEYEKDHTLPYTTFLGCKVSNLEEVPEDLDGIHIAENRYQHFTAEGSLEDGIVYETWQKIWSSDLPRTYAADFEIYGEKAQNPQDAKVDIYIGIH
ncbi:GyrI-like domain-containing protein [uncultured Sphingobacterium sp.]|uniref:GyrI-like domain-containing protein n=1 Tax=Sphingobacterium sp. R2 TaxID=3112958 RepID=UPI0025F75FC2|nr:GyrI-like domain-containing protein [uncultured Sphingobacterium sp.]